jgi:malto-oligosyltrehalose trehalohydrolase
LIRSAFSKSWGAEPVGDDRWRFRLWAPGQQRVELAIGDNRYGMDPSNDGWFVAEQTAHAGQSYAFAVGEGTLVPDPAAREQVSDVHGFSRLVDPTEYEWRADWRGRPWEETILYELHIGTFSATHDFEGALAHLDHLAATGVTAIELCPVAQFSGNRGWGYDGVLLYAPHRAYGGALGLKRLVDAAHERGLMVFLDVVYNHFGPDGNYLHLYAPEFFHPERHTPWGAAIAFDRPPVRQFFVENALYWLDEYRIDGLRLDAVDQIDDPSDESILVEIARAVRQFGFDRHVHLTTEDDRNVSFLHTRDEDGRTLLYDGEWNDDFHNVAHVLATGEASGYYADYSADPRGDVVTALTQGFVQQGRPSPYRGGEPRGESSRHLPPTAFVNFLQNHDQIGNRAFGERLTTLADPRAVEVLTALLMLSPMTPLFFMGEEWGETRPFLFFCDFHGELGDAVRQGRRREFARWPQFADPETRERIPDPNDPNTFAASVLDWSALTSERAEARLSLFRRLTALRSREIAPRLKGITATNGRAQLVGDRGFALSWTLGSGDHLSILANLGGTPFAGEPRGRELFRLGDVQRDSWAILAAIAESHG